jgi:polyhydroxyalkanoate synthesis regulator phasin
MRAIIALVSALALAGCDFEPQWKTLQRHETMIDDLDARTADLVDRVDRLEAQVREMESKIHGQ